MFIFKYLFFLFVSSIQLFLAEGEDESSFEDIFNQEEQIQDATENSIHKRDKFIFFKPFKCKKVYFSIVNEVLFRNRLTGFNGYISHFVYDIISLNPCIALLNQIFVFINIFMLMGGVISNYLFLLSLDYLLEILKIFIPKVDFLLGYYGNFKFFYRINYDFGMRMIAYQNKNKFTCKSGGFKQASDSNECVICLQATNSGKLLGHDFNESTSHIFHEDCLKKWYQNHQTCPICRSHIKIDGVIANFTSFFYFDLFPEFYVEYSSNNFHKKVKPFLLLLLGGGIHCIAKELKNWYIIPKIHLGVEGGINFSNKYEIIIYLKPTYIFRNHNFNFYNGKNFLFNCGLIINFITSFKDGD